MHESKNNQKRFLFIVIIFIAMLIGGVVWYANENSGESKEKKEAINQAREYRPTGICPQVITPAIHKETGAKYTFSTGCLPPGWKKERQ